MKIGIDFDNTIIDYDGVFTDLVNELGWLDLKIKHNKQQIRDLLRKTADGESRWVKLQSLAYGKHIHQAEIFDGVFEFLKSCLEYQIPVFVISHKTQFVEQLEEKIDAREEAMAWLRNNGFFDQNRTGLNEGKVFFLPSRAKKIECIRELQLTHFIDDLKEVLEDPSFPKNVSKVLFSRNDTPSVTNGMIVLNSWQAIKNVLMN